MPQVCWEGDAMRLLLIGHGRWGRKLRERFDDLLGPENVVVYDLVPAHIPPRHPDEPHRDVLTGDYRKALDQVDACVIATPPATHAALALDCITSRKRTLVEKPLALTSIDANKLAAAARLWSVPLMVDSTWLYHSEVQRCLSLPAPAEEVRLFWTQPKRATPPEGILWTLGPHPMSLIVRLMGRVARMEGRVSPRSVHLDCWGAQAPNPPRASLYMTWDTAQKVRSMIVLAGGAEQAFIDGAMPHDPASGSRDALTAMCRRFLSLPQDFVEAEAVMVVEALEMASQIGGGGGSPTG